MIRVYAEMEWRNCKISAETDLPAIFFVRGRFTWPRVLGHNRGNVSLRQTDGMNINGTTRGKDEIKHDEPT
ncbi:hypothetical protein BK122_01965 [Paenibacillus pabuli]|nr:hypothetical protein BK122_01965 [Paenibacillus pabuli]